jgi:predicted Zn-dependent protease
MNIEQALAKARQQAEAGNNEASRQCLLDILKQQPNNQTALIMLGGSYFTADMLNEAEMVFERLVLLSPRVGQASIALFNTLWKMNRKAEALEEIRRYMQQVDADDEDETARQYRLIARAIEQGEL